MSYRLLIDSDAFEVRTALVEDDRLVEFHVERPDRPSWVGSIFKGRVRQKVEALNAAFVDIGLSRPAYLFLSGTEAEAVEQGEVDLRAGSEILVQVAKDPLGTKGARVTTRIAMPGRLLVLLPEGDQRSISRRVQDDSQRARLQSWLDDLPSEQGGAIARTAAPGAALSALDTELDRLQMRWRNLRAKAAQTSAPQLLFRELSFGAQRARDYLGCSVGSVVVNSAAVHREIVEELERYSSDLAARCSLDERPDLLAAHGIERELQSLTKTRVGLPSGGGLVIEPTEALVAIDVNSGRSGAGGKSFEQNLLTTNLEAAREIARQVRLRDLAGLLAVDFIDLESPADRTRLMEEFETELARDTASVTVLPMSSFGLVQMTRRRTRRNLWSTVTTGCMECGGIGRVTSPRTLLANFAREIEQLADGVAGQCVVETHPDVLKRWPSAERATLERRVEEKGRRLRFAENPRLSRSEFSLRCEDSP